MRYFFVLLLLWLGFALPAHATANSAWVSTDAVHSQLVASHNSVRAGQTLNIAWHLKLAPKWHVYWSNPGDSGLPPTLTPDNGFTTGPLAFPTPIVISIPPVTNYGYEKDVVLTATLTAPATLAAGKLEVPFSLTYLYCSDEVCMPGRINATLPLIATLSEPEPNPDYAALVQTQVLPQLLPADANLNISYGNKAFTFSFNPAALGNPTTVRFLPEGDGLIHDSAAQTYSNGTLTLPVDPQATRAPLSVKGLLVIDGKGYVLPETSLAPQTSNVAPAASMGLFFALISAFIAGLILNLMPCVLPVLALKAFSLLKGHENRQAAYRHAAGYTLGVVGSFLVLGGLTLILQQSISGIGWGFQLQQPLFVAALCALLTALALSFFGVVEVGTSLTKLGRTGHGQHFTNDALTGLLAVVVATPCTVPFMGGAVAFALTQGPVTGLGIFVALGLGMAAPLVSFTLIPALSRLLPKPGAWLNTFKQILGWPMLATALWLLLVYHAQTDTLQFFTLLTALLGLSFGLWLYGRTPGWKTGLTLALITATGTYAVVKPSTPPANWLVWDTAQVEALRAHRPVFIDFTADWCLTCKVNEATVLNTGKTQALFAKYNVALFKADWTTPNADIAAALESFGRKGVPLYVLYRPDHDPLILPQVLTYGAVEKALR